MSALLASAAACGAVLGAALWLVLVRLPFMRPVSFTERIAPQLRSYSVQSRLLHEAPRNLTPFGPLERILRPVLGDWMRALGRLNPGTTALNRRLVRAGSDKIAVEFRAEQLLWAAGGFLGAVAIVLVSGLTVRLNPLFAVLIVVAAGLAGFMLRDYALGARIKKREVRMMAEFPSVAELMALAVSAGESATGALDRVCRRTQGEMAKEFGLVLASTRAGQPLVEALQEFSARTNLAPLVRFVDGLIVAVERGTPLAEILRAQAQDVRDAAKRDLMESAGKKEIGMMVPLVFGVLPLTVVFAVFPGLAAITLGL